MDFYNNIKDHLIRNEINHRIKDYSKNKGDLETYYEVGKLLVIAQGGEKRAKYGDGLIKEYSKKLVAEVDKKYSYRNLFIMRKFYTMFRSEKVNALRSQLSWTHYRELLVLNDINKINYYIDLTIKLNLSTRELHNHIKNKDYERLDNSTKLKFIENRNIKITETIKNPIIIPNPNGIEVYKEITLQRLILENYQEFLKELGDGFSLIGNEVKINLGNSYNYIDLLLYNIKYKCYVVVELKVTALKKEHIGQIETYMNYIDEHLKTIAEDKTIGIIICKKDNKYVMEYCSDNRILSKEYILV